MARSSGQRLLGFDRKLGVRYVAGADEAGRGSLAGPLVVAGVLLDYETLRGAPRQPARARSTTRSRSRRRSANCSSKRSAPVRRRSASGSCPWARSTGTGCTGRTSPGCGPCWPTPSARRCLPRRRLPARARRRRRTAPSSTGTHAARRSPPPRSSRRSSRDRVMRRLDALYPHYGFMSHVGYITPAHNEAVRAFGPSDLHRRSFQAALLRGGVNRGERRALRTLSTPRLQAARGKRAVGPLRARPRASPRAKVLVVEVKEKSGDGVRRPARDDRRGEGPSRPHRGHRLARVASRARRARGRFRGGSGPRKQCGARRPDVGPAPEPVEPAVMASTQAVLYRELSEELHLSWSEAELPERERTKHVHRLHPYLGKFVPQLVEALLEPLREARGSRARPVRRLGDDAGECLESDYDAVGVDVAAFNCLLMRVKTTRYDLFRLETDVRERSRTARAFARPCTRVRRRSGSLLGRPPSSSHFRSRRRRLRARRRPADRARTRGPVGEAHHPFRPGLPALSPTPAVLVSQAPSRVRAGAGGREVPRPLPRRHARADQSVPECARAGQSCDGRSRRLHRGRSRRGLRRNRSPRRRIRASSTTTSSTGTRTSSSSSTIAESASWAPLLAVRAGEPSTSTCPASRPSFAAMPGHSHLGRRCSSSSTIAAISTRRFSSGAAYGSSNGSSATSTVAPAVGRASTSSPSWSLYGKRKRSVAPGVVGRCQG